MKSKKTVEKFIKAVEKKHPFIGLGQHRKYKDICCCVLCIAYDETRIKDGDSSYENKTGYVRVHDLVKPIGITHCSIYAAIKKRDCLMYYNTNFQKLYKEIQEIADKFKSE